MSLAEGVGLWIGGQRPTEEKPVGVSVAFPQEAMVEVGVEDEDAWVRFDALRFEVVVPEGGPTNVQMMVQIWDWDGALYQRVRKEFLGRGETNEVEIGVGPEAVGWEALGHPGGWHRRTMMRPKGVQVKFFATGAVYGGALEVVRAEGIVVEDEAPPSIRNVRPTEGSRAETPVDGRYELRFEVSDRYANPFDPEEIAVDAEVEAPSGRVVVPCFYYQDCLRQPTATEERILPQGKPEWRLRFSPNEEGVHTIHLVARDRRGETRREAVAVFEAVSAEGLRTVHVSHRDGRYFEDAGGGLFFPLGYNIRSPYDARMDRNYPTRFRHPEGTTSYGRRFAQMGQSGINIAEIWASAWCMGLEWSEQKPGYHGIGQYNLLHAWERDRVFEMAAEQGLRINLVLNNHGRLSDFSDPEWALNPYNSATQPGGWYEDPRQWFSEERARVQYEKLLRYEIARYAWNANLFAWQLWSELNISCRDAHRDPIVHEWHRRMATYLHEHDPKRHPVATHTSGDYRTMIPELAAIQEVDHICGDAYHSSTNTLHIHALMKETKREPHLQKRAALITEFGGTHNGASIDHLRREVHAALWSSVPSGLAGAPMFWWWHIVEEYDFFPMYAAFSKYLAGENFLDAGLEPQPEARYTRAPQPKESEPQLPEVCTDMARSETRGYAWIHALAEQYNGLGVEAEKEYRGYCLELAFPGRDGDVCTVEFWDTGVGERVRTQDYRVRRGKIEAEVPAFGRDIAVKFTLSSADKE